MAKIIGLTLETRPDYINKEEIERFIVSGIDSENILPGGDKNDTFSMSGARPDDVIEYCEDLLEQKKMRTL